MFKRKEKLDEKDKKILELESFIDLQQNTCEKLCGQVFQTRFLLELNNLPFCRSNRKTIKELNKLFNI